MVSGVLHATGDCKAFDLKSPTYLSNLNKK
jgi:hypothetical protein